MAELSYKVLSHSPHSGTLREKRELEWVRVEEVDQAIHEIKRN